MKKICFAFILLCCAAGVFAVSLSELRILAEDGTFLGTFESEHSKNSIYNEYGTYGSKFNAKSIFNQYGNYGSDYSQ